jgi:vacuolar iron transporter family protein
VIDSVQRYLGNLQGEVDSATVYRALSESEGDPHLREIYRRLAAVEEAHAEFWRNRLAQTGAQPRALRAGFRARALAWLARRFGPQFVLPTVSRLEQRDVDQYDHQPEAVAGGLPDAERSHNRIVQAIAASVPADYRATRWRGSKGVTASAAMRCAQPCLARTMASSPI